MQIQQFIPWGEDMDELIFASHTSIISKQLLLEKLCDEGVIEDAKPKKKSDDNEKVSTQRKAKVDKNTLR